MSIFKLIIFSLLMLGVMFTLLISICFLILSFCIVIFGPDNQTTAMEALVSGIIYFAFAIMFGLASTYGIFALLKISKK